ncbi:MAG: VWA domain-containing protein, partial [Acidobacteria bacterium]
MIPRPLHDVFGVPALLLPTAVAAAAVLLAALLLARRSARRRDALVSPSLAARLGLPAHGVSWPAAALAALAVLGTGLALSRPRWGAETESARRMGTDVVLILDTSGSMRATDVSPARFVLARQAASSLVERLGGDRIALVACEGEAQVLVPLTLDLAAVGLFLDALEPGVGTKPGTSLAAGLAAAEELFPAGASGSKQCVFVSDGEDLEGGVEEALEAARKEGMVVHTVFVGSPAGSGAPVPEVDVAGRATGYKTDEKGAPVLSRPNPGLLRQVAARTGGSYSVISPGRTDLFGVAREIDRAARKPLSQELLTSRPERFQIPLGVAVACVGLLLLGGAPGRLRPLPSRRGGAAALLAGLLLAATAAPAQQPPAAPPAAPG